jgi:dienelactone hydrolase
MFRGLNMFAALPLLFAAASPPARADTMYTYDASKTGPVTYGTARTLAPGITARAIDYMSASGHKVTGEIVSGSAKSPQPGVLFVHWLGDAPTTNHTEFEKDAQALAGRGVTSILVDAMWAAPNWFDHMGASVEGDSKETIDQVIDLRTALDVLLAQKNVDASRIAYVGHDFGAMLGALMAGVDVRPKYWVYLAGNPSLTAWYTLGKKSPTHDQYVAAMAKFDILGALRSSKPKAVLLQFSAHDEYVTPEEALTFFAAAPLPRGAFFYDVDHSLAAPQALKDRQAWLVEQLFGG